MSVVECGFCARFVCGVCEYETRRRIDRDPFCNKCGSNLMHKHPVSHLGATKCKYNRPSKLRPKDRTPGVDWRRNPGKR